MLVVRGLWYPSPGRAGPVLASRHPPVDGARAAHGLSVLDTARRITLRALWIVISAVGVFGCTTVATQGPPPGLARERDETSGISLVPSDSDVLKDEDVRRLLEAEVRLPAQMRIGLVQLSEVSTLRFFDSSYGSYGWALDPQSNLNPRFIGTLRASARIRDVSYLPRFLVPDKPSVGHLREAAARYQADAPFLYASECRLYDRYRFLRASEVKAYCVADATLLDVRTGLVPFTSRAQQEITLSEASSDGNYSETVRRAEVRALDAALDENARNLVEFIRLPASDR